MKLNLKDLIVTILVFFVSFNAYRLYTGNSLPLVGTNIRLASIALLVVGIFMCAIGARQDGNSNNLSTTLSSLAICTAILILFAIISGMQIILLTAVAGVVVLWLLTTGRHALGI